MHDITEGIGSLTLWTASNFEAEEVHLGDKFPSFLFLTSFQFALPKFPGLELLQ